MAKKLYEESSVQDIADAIREKTGGAETYKIAQMGGAVRSIKGAETVAWHQCPEAVRNYLSSVTYDPGDYSTSQIDNYAPATAVVSNYRPIGKTLGGKTYCNEVPGIETPFAATGKAGTLKPMDSLRWIMTRTWNVRDLGGWACDGGTVKYGKLFRGGYVTSADRAVLVEQLGIQHELDLRGASEGGLTASPLGGDVRYTCAAAYAWYSLTPADAWKANLRCVFDAVTHNEPVYFHCAAGADRTGTLACVLEGLLGVSQSNIDKDYELTTFYSGSDTDANARRRNEAEWKGLISALNGKPGSTFRDKCVTFAAELGFTASEINAFRAAMIDGTPETVTPDIATFSVANTLSGAATDNTAAEAAQYQPYTAQITADDGKAIGSVRVTMGGTDVTASAWRGEETNLYRRVTLKLSGCSCDNTLRRVIDGQSYGATLAPDADYTLDGAAVKITMGGNDVSKYYSGGKIAIACVTGDIQITVSAVESAVATPNILVDSFKAGGVSHAAVGYSNGKRLSTSDGSLKDASGCIVTGFIPLHEGSVIRIKPFTVSGTGGAGNGVCKYGSDQTFAAASYVTTAIFGTHFANCEWAQESDGVLKISCLGTGGYMRLTVPVADGANAYVTYDAAMPSA